MANKDERFEPKSHWLDKPNYSSNPSEFNPQFTIMELANEMFKGSKPLMGEELDILNRTFSKLLSDKPTKL